MANGDKSRRRNASLQNAGQLQGLENNWDNFAHEFGVNRLATDLLNEARTDAYNFQNETNNFEYQELIRQYEHQRHLYGLNENAIDMEIKYQQDQIYGNADARLQELAYAQQDLDFGFAADSIKNNFAQANNSLALKSNSQDLLINKEQTDQRGRQFGTDMKDMSSKQTQEKADARRKLLKSSLETQAKVGNAAASGRRGQSARMLNQSIESVAAIDHYALYTQLERGEGSFANITSGVTNKKASDDKIAENERKKLGLQRDNLENNKKEMAQLFGLTVEQYEADTEKLGRMMVDTVSNIDSQLNRLSQQEFQTRINLYAKMPLPPRMAPRAKPPREIPYEKRAFPTDPFRMDPNVISAAPEQKKQSGFGTFLQILGTVAAIGGTVLTAGAAAPATAMWGAGLTGGGSVLAGLGQTL